MRFFFIAFLFLQLHEAAGHGCMKKNIVEVLIAQDLNMNAPQNYECSICYEEDLDGKNGCTTPCNHTFCKQCIFQWGRNNPKAKCPMCRNEFNNPFPQLNRDLWNAVKSDRVATIEHLLEQGARVDSTNEIGQTALQFALYRNGYDATNIARVLLKHDANVNIQTVWGRPHGIGIYPYGQRFYENSPFLIATAKQNWSLVEMFIEKEGNLEEYTNVLQNLYRTAQAEKCLHHAVEKGYADIVKILLEHQTSVDSKGDFGATALHVAARNFSRTNIVKILLARNPNINAQDDSGNTPLMEAVKNDSTDVALQLLKYGALVNIRNKNERTALNFAMENENETIIESILAQNANSISLRETARRHHMEQMRFLFGNSETGGPTFLHNAVYDGNESTVKILLGKNLNINAQDENGATALIIATWKGHENLVKLLLAHGADLHLKNASGKTALHHAAYNGYRYIAQLLLKKKSNVNAQDHSGDTPLIFASRNHQEKMVQTLLGHGANPRVENFKGETAMIYSAYRSAAKKNIKEKINGGKSKIQQKEWSKNF